MKEAMVMPNIRSSADLRNGYNEISNLCHVEHEISYVCHIGYEISLLCNISCKI